MHMTAGVGPASHNIAAHVMLLMMLLLMMLLLLVVLMVVLLLMMLLLIVLLTMLLMYDGHDLKVTMQGCSCLYYAHCECTDAIDKETYQNVTVF